MEDALKAVEAAVLLAPTRARKQEPLIAREAPEVLDDVNAPYGLDFSEQNWSALSKPLEKAGYRLRPRYQPGWVGSWVGTKKRPETCEDSIRLSNVGVIIDAIRIKDGEPVLLKLWNNDERDGPELGPLLSFSKEPRASDPRNHCVPLLDRFTFPEGEKWFKMILVEPLLRDWRDPPFVMIAEVLSFIWQTIEGLEFMHENGVAHGDIHSGNIMMDPKPLFPDGFHPAFNWNPRRREFEKHVRHRTRLQAPVKYYYIDFGSSVTFEEGEERVPVTASWAVWRLPEIGPDGDREYDVFKADIYALGLTLLNEIRHRTGLDFLIPTFESMISEDPDKRPSISEVKASFRTLLDGLSSRKKRGKVGWSRSFSPTLRQSLELWMEYPRVLWHSYRYGLPKDLTPAKEKFP